MTALRHRGFTLIELMIGISIGVLLVTLGVPYFGVWLADSQIKNGAETIAGGLRYAQSQAIKLNQPVRFVIDPTPTTGKWDVQDDITGTSIQKGYFAEAAEKANFLPLPGGATTVTFSGLGRIVPNTDASATLFRVDVTMPVAGSRPLRVVFGAGGFTGIKICDPKWPAADPKGCPT